MTESNTPSKSRRSKRGSLELKSIWDECLLSPELINRRHRNVLWTYLLHRMPALEPVIGGEDDRAEENAKEGESRRMDHLLQNLPYRQMSIPYVAEDKIRNGFRCFTSKIVERSDSYRGDTTKLLIELQDGHRIETVIMRHRGHSTVCVSSQIGCKMGCKFCATGTMGIIGDLTSGEILEQLVHANRIQKIRNVVFMGMGEPLNNFENVKLAVEFMVDSERFGLSPRHVTVSTVGVVKSMFRLTDEMPYVNLALSLHAPNQEVRTKIVPAASGNRLERLMEGIDNHIAHNMRANRKFRLKHSTVMIEYILIRGVNDRSEHAHELGRLLLPRRERILLNLIPYNPTEAGDTEGYLAPTEEDVNLFYMIVTSEDYKLYTRKRQEMGQDIAGACGQLALVKPGKADAQADSNKNKGSVESFPSSSKESLSLIQDIEESGKSIPNIISARRVSPPLPRRQQPAGKFAEKSDIFGVSFSRSFVVSAVSLLAFYALGRCNHLFRK